jgi:hypothetical protein
MSAATTLYTTMQQLSAVVGISAGAAALEAAAAFSGHARASLGDYSIAFLAVTLISLLAPPVSLLLARDAGTELSGHRVEATSR